MALASDCPVSDWEMRSNCQVLSLRSRPDRHVNAQRLRKMVADVSQRHLQAVGLWREDERFGLRRLPAVAPTGHHYLSNAIRDVVPQISFDQMRWEVHRGGHPVRAPDRAVDDDDTGGGDTRRGIACL